MKVQGANPISFKHFSNLARSSDFYQCIATEIRESVLMSRLLVLFMFFKHTVVLSGTLDCVKGTLEPEVVGRILERTTASNSANN